MQDDRAQQIIKAVEMGLTAGDIKALFNVSKTDVKKIIEGIDVQFKSKRTVRNDSRPNRSSGDQKVRQVSKVDGASSQTSGPVQFNSATRRGIGVNSDSAKKLRKKKMKADLKKAKTEGDMREIAYAYSVLEFELLQSLHRKRPRLPMEIMATLAKRYAVMHEVAKSRSESILKCFKFHKELNAKMVSELLNVHDKSASNTMDIMFRDGVLNRERIGNTYSKHSHWQYTLKEKT